MSRNQITQSWDSYLLLPHRIQSIENFKKIVQIGDQKFFAHVEFGSENEEIVKKYLVV